MDFRCITLSLADISSRPFFLGDGVKMVLVLL